MRSTSRASSLSLIAASLVALCASAASADEPKPAAPPPDAVTAEAREHFMRGQTLYEQGQIDASLLELSRAYELKPSFRLLFNIAELAFTIHDYARSQDGFERYLRDGGDEIEPSKRAEATSKLATLNVLVGKMAITVDAPDAQVSIDDTPVGRTPLRDPIRVNSGRRRVTVTRVGYIPTTTIFPVLGGEITEAKLHLAPLVAPPVPSRWTPLAIGGLTAGGALLVAGGVMGGLAIVASNDLGNTTYAGSTPSQEFLDIQSRANLDRTLAFVLGAAGLVTGGVTLAWTLTHPPRAKEPSRAHLDASPRFTVRACTKEPRRNKLRVCTAHGVFRTRGIDAAIRV